MRSCVSTFLNLTTLTILVITTSLVAALYLGTVSWLRDYVDSNPLARTVEVSSIFGSKTSIFKPKDIEEIRRLTLEEGASPVDGVYGWNDTTFWFYNSQGGQDDTLTHGRTVDPQDPILQRLNYLAGSGRFEEEGIGQAVVSAALLESLGYDFQRIPERFQLDYSEIAAPLGVIGVVADVPAGDFLITELFHRAILDRQWNPLPRIPGFYLGPVVSSPELLEALENLQPYLERRSVVVEAVRRNGTEQWLFFNREEAWTKDLWQQLFLPSIHQRLEKFTEGVRLEWREPLPSEVPSRRSLEPEFTRASIYVGSLGEVPAVADAVTAMGLQVTSNSRELALLFLQISSLGQGILLAVILVVGGLASVSLVLSFSQDIRRKTPEIAILKAYGASNRLVLGTYTVEALILWLLATSFGLMVASQLAEAVNAQLVEILQWQGYMPILEDRRLVVMPLHLKLTVAGGSLILCVAATLLAGSIAARLQPAQALNLHR